MEATSTSVPIAMLRRDHHLVVFDLDARCRAPCLRSITIEKLIDEQNVLWKGPPHPLVERDHNRPAAPSQCHKERVIGGMVSCERKRECFRPQQGA